MRFSVYQESQIGGRKMNQDRMGYSFTRDALLLLLADGMGGHLHGEVAATIAMQTVGALFQQQSTPYIKKPERFLEDSFFAAHREIHRHRALHDLAETPRTTIVACLIQHNTAFDTNGTTIIGYGVPNNPAQNRSIQQGTAGFAQMKYGLRTGLFVQYIPSDELPILKEFPIAIGADLTAKTTKKA